MVAFIRDVSQFDKLMHERYREFCFQLELLHPYDVSSMIFPHSLYRRYNTASDLFNFYNRQGGLFDRIRHKLSWGNYFRRMTHYDNNGEPVNQLGNIINSINCADKLFKAANTILIQFVGNETIRKRGGPCLNYIAVQLNWNQAGRKCINLLCVYRNHDFLEKAYGNYWGLCNLLKFLARETDSLDGSICCISSHAYVDRNRRKLRAFLEER